MSPPIRKVVNCDEDWIGRCREGQEEGTSLQSSNIQTARWSRGNVEGVKSMHVKKTVVIRDAALILLIDFIP